MKINLIIFLSLLFSFHCYSQQIENVNFKVDNNVMVVTYDLVNCPNGNTYDVNLKIIGDSGIYIPKSISGDLKNVYPGKNKKIEWSMLFDNTKIKDKDKIKAIVEINEIHSNSLKIKGGPANAILSVILPGTGDIFVQKENKIVPYPIMLAYIGSVYMAIQNYSNYKSFKKEPLSPTGYYSTLKYSRESYYERFLISAGIATSILIVDVIHIAVKGTKNKRKQLGYANNNLRVKLNFAGTPANYQIGLVKQF